MASAGDVLPSLTVEELALATTGLHEEILSRDAIAPSGSRTHWEVGGPPPEAPTIDAPSGLVAHDPGELTITVGAGTRVESVLDHLKAFGQEIVFDPRDADSTVGGTIAAGLSGFRRLRHGPLRDCVLQLHFVTGDGRAARAGGPTVKNVTGYDICRLLVGSLGALAVVTAATLRCQPSPPASRWHSTGEPAESVRQKLYRPSAVVWDGHTTRVLLEGHPEDLASEAPAVEPSEDDAPPDWPRGRHRGRASVPPDRTVEVVDAIVGAGADALGECGVGTVHVATDDEELLARAREVAESTGGWLLREAGAPRLDGWGRAPRQLDLHRRIKDVFDPQRRLSPGRVPW